ncbi:MAG TPA: rhomboid family intramembrane serine protease, partial [Gemmataceae bacterium]|nr:rhomboid family intramembrane serine protease [Gemmataceae bacterium]
MGIHDRDYYRDDGGSWLSSLTRHGQVCTWLIVLNIIMFVAQIASHTRPDNLRFPTDEDGSVGIVSGPITRSLDLNAKDVLHGQVWRLITHAFLHGDFMHILINMILLYWFGRDIESVYGGKEFLAFYLTSAVLAGLAFVVASAAGLGSGMQTRAIGASGAVMAVMVLFACHFPLHRIWLLLLVPLPIWIVVVLYVAFDAYQLLVQDAMGVSG